MIEVTPQIEKFVTESKATEGVVYLFCPHTTAGLTVSENADPSVAQDIEKFMEKIAPRSGNYAHREGNADSHIKSVLTGMSLVLHLENGGLVLGQWQGIFFCEYDGPRKRKILIKITQ